MKVVAVTGTNGKTTIHWLVYHALQSLGVPSMRIGTIGFEAPGAAEEGSLTTPDPIHLQELLRRGRDLGAKAAMMEVSSHALDQHRADHVAYDVGVFTNLTRDHLDYHQTMERYFEAKGLLFELIAKGDKKTKGAVINIDDDYGKSYASRATALGLNLYDYGMAKTCRLRISDFDQVLNGSRLTISCDGSSVAVSSAA